MEIGNMETKKKMTCPCPECWLLGKDEGEEVVEKRETVHQAWKKRRERENKTMEKARPRGKRNNGASSHYTSKHYCKHTHVPFQKITWNPKQYFSRKEIHRFLPFESDEVQFCGWWLIFWASSLIDL